MIRASAQDAASPAEGRWTGNDEQRTGAGQVQMRITIVTSPFSCLPPTGIGAIEKRWFYVAREFADAGHSVTFVCKDDQIARDGQHPGFAFRAIRGYRRTGSKLKDVLLDFAYSLKAILASPRTDILVCNTFWSPFLCLLMPWKYGRVVYNVARMPKGQYRFFRHIDRLSCVSHAVAEELLRQSPARVAQVRVISNPINSEAFRYRPPPPESTRVNITYTGRVHPEKGLRLLVRAYGLLRRRHPGLTLTIVGATSVADGGGGEDYVADLQAIAGSHPFEWVPAISDPVRLAEWLGRADIYCYPSVAEAGESFGVAPLEAMAVGRPVVVSALDCFRDFIVDEETGLVFDHRGADPHISLATKLERLIGDAKLRQQLGQRASAIVHQRFSAAAIARRYLADFERLLGDQA